MTAQIRGLNQAARNANDGISLAQTAEGALQETTNMLQRMRELAVQSANDTNTVEDRSSLNAEFNNLIQEINRIATTTAFNGKTMLTGSYATNGFVFHVGANADQTISIRIAGASINALGSGTAVIASTTISTQARANSAMGIIDAAISDIDVMRGDLGAAQNRMESTIANLTNVAENLSAARSRILDADVAQETAIMTKNNILQQAGVAILAQANQTPQLALQLLQG